MSQGNQAEKRGGTVSGGGVNGSRGTLLALAQKMGTKGFKLAKEKIWGQNGRIAVCG